MRRVLIVTVVGVATLGILFAVVVYVAGRFMIATLAPPAGLLYPAAPPMPPPVATPVEDPPAKYEAFLREKAPAVYATLQPGLTDAEIDALEAKHGLKLTADLPGAVPLAERDAAGQHPTGVPQPPLPPPRCRPG